MKHYNRRKVRKNKNIRKSVFGFTLVELLAVVAILGIIIGISLPLIRNIQNNSEDKKYKTYFDSLLSSAKLYNDSYSEDLFGNNKFGCAYITYNDLYERNLIKDIQIENVSCNTDSTFVRVVKLDDKYTYSGYLGCGNKKSDGSVNNISISLPDKNVINEMNTDYCGNDNVSLISVVAAPSKAGTIYDKKSRKMVVKIKSATGISNDLILKYAWEYNGIVSEYKKLGFSIPTNQEDKISNGEVIEVSSGELITPIDANGDVYLRVKVEKLDDLYGNSWDSSGTIDKVVKFGSYKVDNTIPNITKAEINSKESSFNSTNTVILLSASDNLTPTSSLKICVSSNNSCTSYENYSTTKNFKVGTTYDGSTKTVYINIKDLAGNIATKTLNYTIPYKYTLTYNVNADDVSNCSPTSKNVYVMPGESKTWGSLCTPTRTGYTFTGWNTKANGSGNKITSSTYATKNLTVYAQWRLNQVKIKFKTNGGSLASNHGSSISVNSNGYILVNGKDVIHTVNYGNTIGTNGLIDYNNSSYVNITKTGYHAVSGYEWILDGGSSTFNQKTNYLASELCSTIDSGDCTITLKVNWTINKVRIKFKTNGGSLSSSHGSSISVNSNGYILVNGKDVIHTVNYGNTIGTNGLIDYNNSSYVNITKTGYHAVSGYEWILDGGSSTFNQKTNYLASELCSTINSNDCDLTLKVNWDSNVYTISYTLYGGSASSSGMPTSYKYGVGATINGKPTRTDYTFNGWSIYENPTTAAWKKTINATTIGNKTYYAKWCQNCATVSNGTCTLDASVAGTCTYTTTCDSGYTYKSGKNTRNPICVPDSYPEICDYADSQGIGIELFGDLPDQTKDMSNTGSLISGSGSWSAWCMKNFNTTGKKCQADAYHRVCYDKDKCGIYYGKTAAYINEKENCTFYKYWCYKCK